MTYLDWSFSQVIFRNGRSGHRAVCLTFHLWPGWSSTTRSKRSFLLILVSFQNDMLIDNIWRYPNLMELKVYTTSCIFVAWIVPYLQPPTSNRRSEARHPLSRTIRLPDFIARQEDRCYHTFPHRLPPVPNTVPHSFWCISQVISSPHLNIVRRYF